MEDEEQGTPEYVQGPSVLLAGDAEHIYIIAPYEYYHTGSCSLFDYCATQPDGRLSEETARPFFQQIVKVCMFFCFEDQWVLLSFVNQIPHFSLVVRVGSFWQGLETLQRVQICHRNLSLESVVLRQRSNTRVRGQSVSSANNNNNDGTCYQCTITQLGNAVRVPLSSLPQDDDKQDTEHMSPATATLLSVAGRNPQYVAPELWGDQSESDSHLGHGTSTYTTSVEGGYASDLWSAGVMLLAMLLGSDALFAAPIPADPVFRRITDRHHLKEYIATQNMNSSASSPMGGAKNRFISEEAVDLLQRMLRVEPSERLTLTDLVQHPWLYSDIKGLT